MNSNTVEGRKEIKRFIASHKRRVAKLSKMRVQSNIGCGLGFRKAAKFCSKEELLALRVGEDAVAIRALIHNGAHPDYQNGGARGRWKRLGAFQPSVGPSMDNAVLISFLASPGYSVKL